MFSKFIHRPVLSIVLSLIITLLGALSIYRLPMTQFPSIAPPEVNVTTEFTGANAETSIKAVVTPLERAINGVPGMKYMSSDAGNDGVSVVQVLFEIGTDPDVAAVNVQNRVAAVMAELPSEVIKNGVKIAKEENSMLMYLNIFSKDSTLDEKFLYNFVDINVLAELKRIKGVGFADILGAREYAMRVWLKPDRMLAYNVSTDEVIDALQEQNIEAAPGKVGESSDRKSQSLQYVLKYTGRYNTKEEYENIVIRSNKDGEMLRIKDIAEVEFGTTYFDVISKFNGQSSAAIMIKQLPGSNASKVIEGIKERMAHLKKSSFPPGMDYEMSYDVSRFLDASIQQVLGTLFEAFLLVALVVFIFLQDFRSTLIPAIAVPVSLIGTFFFMQLFGFSINLITLFALVLAIGIVVDDAIVVVEAVHAKMEKDNLDPLTATVEAMKEISGAILAITLVMTAVFVPVMFMSGPVGIFFRQFAVTMSIAIIISAVNALTLSPALCAIILKNNHGEKKNTLLNRFFGKFNNYYDKLSVRYQRLLSVIASRKVVTFSVLILFCIGTWGINQILPSGFIPNEDQGTFYASITTPSGSTIERTETVVDQIQKAAEGIPGIESVSSLAGINVLSDGTGATYGTCLINLKDWNKRKHSVTEISNMLAEKTRHIKDAKIEYFPPPAVPGYGNASGFELRLLDKTGSSDLKQLETVTHKFMKDLTDRPEIENAFTIFDASFPQYLLKVDNDKAAQKGISVGNAMSTLQTLIGSEYATNFIRFGQMYKVMVQAAPKYRALPEDILKLYVKNKDGEMVPYAAFLKIERVYGIEQATRYNMYMSAELNGEASSGYSSGSAIKAIQEVASTKLPRGYEIDWAGISRDEVLAGNEAIYIFLICLLFVYLVLSAQYESFLLPMPVILFLPTGIFGAFLFLSLFGLENNIYAQIALIMLIGLLGKNAILIVEFAILKQNEGSSPFQAAIEGATIRLRPILMTSFAFIAGLIPLILSSGAGEIGNRTIGAAAAGGMLFGTIFGIIIIPGLYVVFATLALKFTSNRGKKVQVEKFATGTSVILIFLTLSITSCKTNKPLLDESFKKSIPTSFVNKSDSANLAVVNWKNYFNDSTLVSLIDTALVNNYDVMIALQRMEAARSNVKLANGAFAPAVSAYASAAQRKFGLYTMDGAGNITTEMTRGQIVPIHLKDYYIGLQTSWELDVWGKLRNRKKAAVARYLANTEGKNLVITNLIADLANTYYELLAHDNELDILQETIRLQENALEIVRVQKRAGVANELAVEQFEGQLLDTRALEKEVMQDRLEAENKINYLSGGFPKPITRNKTNFFSPIPFQVNLGFPSDLLRNRPDIRQAEYNLLAARADLKAARAAFYPSLNINGAYGFQAFETGLLFLRPESIAYTLLGGLTAPLINRTAIKSAFRYNSASQREALYTYQQSIVNGYTEVYNEVARVRNLQEIQAFKRQQVTVLTRSIETSSVLFRTGRATYLEVLLSQKNALDAKLELVDTQKRQYFTYVNIYKALGGGWQ